MSKKYGVMDLNFQIWNMNRHLKCNFIVPDIIDIVSLLDRTLHFPENQELIDKQLGISDNYYKYHTYIDCIEQKTITTDYEKKILKEYKR